MVPRLEARFRNGIALAQIAAPCGVLRSACVVLNLTNRLTQLSAPARQLLDRSAETALAHGATPYLVGGSVRDLLLGRATLDLDIVVVGDALAVAAALRDALGGSLHTHPAFGTAKLVLPDGTALDLITARQEHYPAPVSYTHLTLPTKRIV